MKKIKTTLLLALSLAGLSGCSSISMPDLNNKEPLYKISDQDTKIWIDRANQIAHCIYPKLKGLSLEEAEKRVYSQKSNEETRALGYLIVVGELSSVIGENAAKIIHTDKLSRNYLNEQHKKFNHNDVSQELDNKTCKDVKKDFQQILKEVKNSNL